jgi:hypothetical protein
MKKLLLLITLFSTITLFAGQKNPVEYDISTDECPYDLDFTGAIKFKGITKPLDNFSATTAPTVNDDSEDGYSKGSRWFDIANQKLYVCYDATTGAAVWKLAGGGHVIQDNGSDMPTQNKLNFQDMQLSNDAGNNATIVSPLIDNDNIQSNAGIDATKLADGTVNNTELKALDGITGNIQNQLTDKPPVNLLKNSDFSKLTEATDSTTIIDNANLVYNNSFETDTSGWIEDESHSFYQISSNQEKEGSYSLHMVKSPDGPCETHYDIITEIGVKYKASIWLYNDGSSDDWRLSAKDSQGVIAYEELSPANDLSWTEMTLDFTARETTTEIHVRIYDIGGQPTEGYLDSVTVSRYISEFTGADTKAPDNWEKESGLTIQVYNEDTVNGYGSNILKISHDSSLKLFTQQLDAQLARNFQNGHISLGCWVSTDNSSAVRFFACIDGEKQYGNYNSVTGSRCWLSFSQAISTETVDYIGLEFAGNSGTTYISPVTCAKASSIGTGNYLPDSRTPSRIDDVTQVNDNGDIAIQTTPSTWATTFTPLQLSNAAIVGRSDDPDVIYIYANSYWDGSNTKYISDGYASQYYQSNGMHVWQSATSGTAGNNVTFSERMRLDENGNLGIGHPPVYNLDVYESSGDVLVQAQSASLSDGQRSRFQALGYSSNARYAEVGVYVHSGITEACAYLRMSPADLAARYLWVDDTGDLRISSTVTHIGTTSGTVIGDQTSDIRVKDNVNNISYGLAEVLQLEPIVFKYKDNPEKTRLGFSAQHTENIIPEVVYNTNDFVEDPTGEDIELQKEEKDKDGKVTQEKIIKKGCLDKRAMRYAELVPVLVKAIQEQQAQIDDLKAEIEKLKNR